MVLPAVLGRHVFHPKWPQHFRLVNPDMLQEIATQSRCFFFQSTKPMIVYQSFGFVVSPQTLRLGGHQSVAHVLLGDGAAMRIHGCFHRVMEDPQ